MADENCVTMSDPGDPDPAPETDSVIDPEKPKKKSIIVWQCLNPECTNTNKRVLRLD